MRWLRTNWHGRENFIMSVTLADKESVLREKADHPAVVAILSWKANALTQARWDRDELTLTIAQEEIQGAGLAVKQAGYNFLEDVTAVDWFPASPRFQICYPILSQSMKERIPLR